jgi:MoaA/NifB/PqqE/SkfB family radical SAM enzyme
MNYKFFIKNFNNLVKKKLSASFNLTLSKPLEVSFFLTKRCNARCLMCDFWEAQDDHLTSEDIIVAFSELKSWIGDNFFVQLSGGEPLIFKGIFDVFTYGSNNGIICKISTNGYALTDNICDKIIESKLPYLSVSLDSHLKEVHDRMRGVDGMFDRAIHGIKYLAEHSDMTLGISVVLSSENVKNFPETIEYFLSLPIHRILIQPIGVWTEDLPVEQWRQYRFWVNDMPALDRAINYLIEKRKKDNRLLNTEQDFLDWKTYFENPASTIDKRAKKCSIGYDRLSIDGKGDVFAGCGNFGELGTIKDHSIRKMWYSQNAKDIRRKMMRCTYPCNYNCFKDRSLMEKVKKAMVLMKAGLLK